MSKTVIKLKESEESQLDNTQVYKRGNCSKSNILINETNVPEDLLSSNETDMKKIS